MRARYTVTEVAPMSPDTRVFTVRKDATPEFLATHVWYTTSAVRSPRAYCCKCQGIQTAMSSSCTHARAVRRFITRQPAGTDSKEPNPPCGPPDTTPNT